MLASWFRGRLQGAESPHLLGHHSLLLGAPVSTGCPWGVGELGLQPPHGGLRVLTKSASYSARMMEGELLRGHLEWGLRVALND